MLANVTPQCSVSLTITATLQCSLLLMVTVTLQCSVLFMVTVSSVVFTDPYGHCHPAVSCAPFGHCHCAPYRRSAVVMNVPVPRTASRPSDAAASHPRHFNTVLYPRSYSECQLPLNRSRRDITGAASSAQNDRKIFAVTTSSSLAPLQTCRHIYNAI